MWGTFCVKGVLSGILCSVVAMLAVELVRPAKECDNIYVSRKRRDLFIIVTADLTFKGISNISALMYIFTYACM